MHFPYFGACVYCRCVKSQSDSSDVRWLLMVCKIHIYYNLEYYAHSLTPPGPTLRGLARLDSMNKTIYIRACLLPSLLSSQFPPNGVATTTVLYFAVLGLYYVELRRLLCYFDASKLRWEERQTDRQKERDKQKERQTGESQTGAQ